MNVKTFIKAVRESQAEASYAKVGAPSGDGIASQERRTVPVAKLPKRGNAAVPTKEVPAPKMGTHKNEKPTADVGEVDNDGIAFSGRRDVPVAKLGESEVSLLSDDDLVV